MFADFGSGISSEHLNPLFERSTVWTKRVRASPAGTGLGLAISPSNVVEGALRHDSRRKRVEPRIDFLLHFAAAARAGDGMKNSRLVERGASTRLQTAERVEKADSSRAEAARKDKNQPLIGTT